MLYETVGVCQVKNVSTLDFLKKDRLYYSICPVFQKDTVIYVPVDNEKVKMRPVMSREEAEEFISELPQIQGIQAENDKERFQMYKQMLFSGDRREWAAMTAPGQRRGQRYEKNRQAESCRPDGGRQAGERNQPW